MRRPDPVIQFTQRPEPGPVREIQDVLQGILGKTVSLVDVALLVETAGYTVTNAAGGAGTALDFARTKVDFGDAGIDSVRLTARGNNSGAGSVTLSVYDVTNSVELCRVTVTGVTVTTYAGSWTAITPTGSDQEIEVRCIGDGAADPIFYRVGLQCRTTQARA